MARSLAELLADKLDQEFTPNTRRIVTRSGSRKRGFYMSARFGEQPYESPIERDMLSRLDHSWMSSQVEAQAITLRVPCTTDERGYFFYSPDALVMDRQQRLYVLEAKSFAELQTEEVRDRHRSIRWLLAPKGIRFVEAHELDMGSLVLAENLDLLSRARSWKDCSRHMAATRALVNRTQPTTFGHLLDVLDRFRALSALSHGLLTFDLNHPLGPLTVLSTQPNEAIDAALFLYSRPDDPTSR